MKAMEQNKSFNKNEAVTYHVVDVAGRRSMAEDILGKCIYRGIAAPGRAGWPTGHAEQLRWPCRALSGLRRRVGETDSLLAGRRV